MGGIVDPVNRSASRTAARLALCAALAAATGCTIVKPVACGLTAGTIETANRIDRASEEDEPDDLPGPLLVAALPVLFPLNFVYWTAHGTVAGLFSGFASDLNLVTGHGTIDRTWETLLVPMKTNAEVEG
jgi:hypothetical protein